MGIFNIAGISDNRSAAVFGNILSDRKGQGLVITANANRANKIASDLSFFIKKRVYVLDSEDETLTFYDAKNRDAMNKRLEIIKEIKKDKNCVVVAPIFSAIKKMIPKEIFFKHCLSFGIGDECDLKKIAEKLVEIGYERVSMVYGKGQFALRGSILDIYMPYKENPVRIELFDIEIESIRVFDVDTQRSVKKLKKVEVIPAITVIYDKDTAKKAIDKVEKRYSSIPERREELIQNILSKENLQLLEYFVEYFYDSSENIIQYMEDSTIMIDDPNRIIESLEIRNLEYNEDFKELIKKEKLVPEDFENFSKEEDFFEIINSKRDIYIATPFTSKIKGIDIFDAITNIKARDIVSFNGQMDMFLKEISLLLKNKYDITVVCSTKERVANIKDFLDRNNLLGAVKVVNGILSRGMIFDDEKNAIITDTDIFGTQRIAKKKGKKYKNAKPIKSFAQIKAGDYVVHENHGVGKFLGIKQLELSGVKKDYLHIQYAGDDMLYIPVENLDMVQRYVGSEAITPKINRLSGTEWKKTKAKAKEAVLQMAKELIELSAQRKAEPGFAFGKDTVWQREFEDAFPYEETQDQLKCIDEIKKDMQKPEAMDRLLCGDVGYGKTEVAARAMFKCVEEGKQVAVLVPTTILANQHYNTLRTRFEKFPFKVEMLSRFRTPAQQKEIIKGIKKGSIDIIVGTHRLLSEDIIYKDLGLLVIDEEQRFGVNHKEKIKQIRKNVDVLTLSATPIPRTLHMSLVGIRNMSVIEEPPQERIPVQTYVMEEDDYIIREAIERETARGGQVFIVYNRIRGIQRLAKRISDLVPDKKIIVGHGQMNEHQLEDVMMTFVEGKADVLIATTIIETGIDIPNANTEIIIDADKYGLSQLYQLRGRVGRSTKLAYAYLMHKKDKVLNEVAEKRLRAIKEFTEFGAGFKIAMRDLEIRGAGNILGTEQHGHMISVGYELYCKLVDEAVAALKGEIVRDEREEVNIDIKIPAYIPNTYVSDENVKLNIYKQIAEVEDDVEAKELEEELDDRFGNIPKEVENLILVSQIKHLAENLYIKRIKETDNTIVFYYAKGINKPLVIYKRTGVDLLEDIKDFLHSITKKN